jgi:hypothetical protein
LSPLNYRCVIDFGASSTDALVTDLACRGKEGDMPSIPQSLLWISLVVLWLFVLVPMLINKRDAVRRTSDVALATRVINSGTRLLRRNGPAAGHRSDPDWQPADDDLDDELYEVHADTDSNEDDPKRSVVRASTATETEPDDVVEDSGALPGGGPATRAAEDVSDAAPSPQGETDGTADQYEYVDDSSGLEAPDEGDLRVAESLLEARRRRYESKTSAAVSARKYKFRKRMLAFLVLAVVASTAVACTLAPEAWWVCGSAGGVTVLYLAYLRRQTRIEERVRRRRAQRMARARLGVENTADKDFDVVPSRLRRPGAVVLEIDDEDPIFEHLDDGPSAGNFDLPRAAGQ